MRTRNATLDRWVVKSPCPASWNEMTNQGPATRHCAQCDRAVHDLALLTPREIRRLIESHGGRFCGRLTRDARGRIVTRLPPSPSSFEVTSRPSSWAAALVAGMLSLPGALPAQTLPLLAAEASADTTSPNAAPARPEESPSASLFGRITDNEGALPGFKIEAFHVENGGHESTLTDAEGRFVFVGLAPGVYRVEGSLEGFASLEQEGVLLAEGERRELNFSAGVVEHLVMGEMLTIPASALRQAFHASPLVAAAVVGFSKQVDPDGDPSQLHIELFITDWLKGPAGEGVLTVERYGSLDPESDDLPPGSEVLAFLEPADEGVWQEADWSFGLKALSVAELTAYRRQLAALAALDPGSDAYARDLAAWWVATAAEPLTRDAVVQELNLGLDQLEEPVEGAEATIAAAVDDAHQERSARDSEAAAGAVEEPSAADLAILLTDADRHRLTQALEATHGITGGDLGLVQVVARWAPERATAWLIREFRRAAPADSEIAEATIQVLIELLPGSALELFQEQLDEVEEQDFGDLVRRFQRALGG